MKLELIKSNMFIEEILVKRMRTRFLLGRISFDITVTVWRRS